jgi:murein DD-endopeptidase MepM/ murein hydrolase activator NlpD
MKRGGILAVSLIIIGTIVFVWGYFQPRENSNNNETNIIGIDSIAEPNMEYGLNLDSFIIHKNIIKPNQFLANILLQYHVPYTEIDKLAKQSKQVFDVRKIAAGKNYTILCKKDSIEKAQYFIYEPNEIDYIVYDMTDSLLIYKGEKEVTTKIQQASGTIKSSLYQTLDDADVSPILAIEMADVFAWTIDFYRIQKGDWFKVIYEEKFVEGKSIGVGRVLASNFNHYNKDFFACYFVQDSIGDYFDVEANSLRRAFLKSPLKFGRLSSGFTMRRFHPVQKRNKPHLGTDYAAPTGTPIMATGDGIVIASSRSKYNGNFVKIKHNSTYTTQYLHMSKRIAKVGEHVIQGDIIGYVGSTGLATGPHVCYRFWKNGSQTNHLKEDFPPSKPVEAAHVERYKKELKKYKIKMDKIKLKGFNS